jgi:threonine dehydratase
VYNSAGSVLCGPCLGYAACRRYGQRPRESGLAAPKREECRREGGARPPKREECRREGGYDRPVNEHAPAGGSSGPSLLDALLRRILTSRVYDVARDTPLDPAPRLSARLSNRVHLKREDLQSVFSFKVRGAYNRMAHLSAAERGRGVITASAGNHAQGVACSAQKLGLRAVIVMPRTTPEIKVDAVRARGAEVVLVGDSYSDAQAHCDQLAAETGLTFIHPFDDPLVIAGQGTVGDEIVRHRQGEALNAVFVPVGGGGLLAGVAGYIKAVLPNVRVVGVEPFESDAMYQSLRAGRRVTLDHVGLFADGVAVRTVGTHTFQIAQLAVDEIVRVSNDEMCAAIKDIFDDTRSVMEPAGALSVAGLKRWVAETGCRDQHLVAILSGANMNFDRLRFVAERAELGEEREALFAVTIPERPGAYRDFCVAIGQRVVTEFNYRLNGRQEAHIFVGVGVDSRSDAATLAQELRARGYETLDLSDNEMAKLHVRHMVGGAAPDVRSERLYRFEFPERPGALTKFLDTLGGRWNISLFHYRNHGADFGRVLVGFEVPDDQEAPFGTFLETLGYPYQRELDNPAYTRFLTPGA